MKKTRFRLTPTNREIEPKICNAPPPKGIVYLKEDVGPKKNSDFENFDPQIIVGVWA